MKKGDKVGLEDGEVGTIEQANKVTVDVVTDDGDTERVRMEDVSTHDDVGAKKLLRFPQRAG